MQWQYRTILFEFQKDGLLGDKYVDDEEVERVLNEQGEQRWELVSVTAVQEGLLTFFKRMQAKSGQQAVGAGQPVAPRAPVPLNPPAAAQPPPVREGQMPVPGRPPQAVDPQPLASKKKGSGIGEIKIS